jgi:acetylornithine deacetylase/succinyl-diaminopimelate desuccinylase-like protein
VLTTDGLGEQKGAESLAKNPVIHNSIGILVLGPTGIRPIIGQIGYAAVKVRTVGEGSVMKMAAFLKMLTNQIAESSGQLSVKTGLIKGGKKKRPFESPRSCEVILELETLEATVSAIEKMESLLSGMEYEIEVLCQSEMIEFDRSSDLAKILADFTKKEPAFELIHSEAAKIVPVNQKIMICGPGNIVDAVTAQEYVTLSDLERTYEAILNLMDRLSPLEIEVPRLTDQ